MRICFISRRYFPAISGMSVYALNLLRELQAAGHDVTMISQYRGDETGTRVYGGGPPPPLDGVKIIGLEALGEQSGGNFEADIETMLRVALEEHTRQPFDIFHAQYGYPNGLVAIEASKQTGVPSIVSIQGGDGHWVGTCCSTHKAAMAAVLNHADALLIGSRSFAEEVRQNNGTPISRFTIVPGGVDVHRFSPGMPHQPLRVLYHGRVDARKGVLDLLDAWHEMKTDAQLIISGIGPDVQAVEERVRLYGLQDSVLRTGHVAYENVPEVYRSADIFVSPTYAEGFSNTILEAMASGLPVVSTQSVGVVDCIKNEHNGLMTNPGDISALVRALTRLIEDAQLRERLSATALQEARTLYSWQNVARLIMNVYEAVQHKLPDTNWSLSGEVAPCRFRAAPHLL